MAVFVANGCSYNDVTSKVESFGAVHMQNYGDSVSEIFDRYIVNIQSDIS